MKSNLLHSWGFSISLLCVGPLAFAKAPKDLTATGNLDIDGESASFGTNGTNPGYSLIYTDSSPVTIDFSASASDANWIWHQGISNPQLKLSNANVLTLFNPNTGTAGITLIPSGATTFATNTGGGITMELLRLQSVGAITNGTAQRISGRVEDLSAYLDFKLFDISGPATGLTLGTLGGDVLTIRSSGPSDAGAVGIGTTSPTAKLEVVGNAKISGTLAVGGEIVVTSSQLAGYATIGQLAAYQPVAGSGAGLTNINASALTMGTISIAVLPAEITCLGVTVELNADETTGNLVWSRVDKTGSTLADLLIRNFADLQSKPTTLTGYGITDAVQKNTDGDIVVVGTTTLNGNLAVNGLVTKLRIVPQGDLNMGEFTASPTP